MNLVILPDNPQVVTKLLTIGQLAVELHKAKRAAALAKTAYRDALQEYEEEHGKQPGRLDPRDEIHAGIIIHTKATFGAYRTAKRQVYNAQRRLDAAIRKLARLAEVAA